MEILLQCMTGSYIFCCCWTLCSWWVNNYIKHIMMNISKLCNELLPQDILHSFLLGNLAHPNYLTIDLVLLIPTSSSYILISIPIQISLKGMSISWQEIGGTHGGDSSGYIGQPGISFRAVRYSSSQRKCHHDWEAWELFYKKSKLSIKLSPYLLQLFINYIH